MAHQMKSAFGLLGMFLAANLAYGAECGVDTEAPRPTQEQVNQYITALSAQLDTTKAAIIQSMQSTGQKFSPVAFSANLFFAHGSFIAYMPVSTMKKYIDALAKAGATRIDINPGFKAWISKDAAVIAKYDEVIQYVKAKGLKLALNPQYGCGDFAVSKFADWEANTIPVYRELARRYQPDLFVIVHEPTTMAARLKLSVTEEEWKNFVIKGNLAVKLASPVTKTGAGGHYGEISLSTKFASIAGLDVITLTIYTLNEFDAYRLVIFRAKAKGKTVEIEETWRFPPQVPASGGQTLETQSSQGIGDGQFEVVDRKWLDTMTVFASAAGVTTITPFWSQTFFKYLPASEKPDGTSWTYNAKAAAAVDAGETTSTYTTFSDLIRIFSKAR